MPTSILREVAYMNQLNIPNVNKIESCEVITKQSNDQEFTHFAAIVYPYEDHNLREFMKAIGPPTMPEYLI